MLTSGSELPLLAIKTGKYEERASISSKGLYRKSSIPQSSVEVYYGGASECVAIPFGWESEPGTPKAVFRETPLPPLTPPPSFLLNSPQTPFRKHSKLKPSLLYTFLPKLTHRKRSQSPASPASSTSYSLSSSQGRESQFSSARSSFESRRPLPSKDEVDSPVSTLCFGIRRSMSSQSRRGCSPHIVKVLLGES